MHCHSYRKGFDRKKFLIGREKIFRGKKESILVWGQLGD